MSEAAIQARIKTLLETIVVLKPQNDVAAVTLGDFSVLDRGLEAMVVIVPGPLRSGDEDMPDTEIIWTVYLDYFCRGDDWTAFRDTRQEIVNLTVNYPTLDTLAGVQRVRIGAGTAPPIYVQDKATGRVLWTFERIALDVHEWNEVSGGEFG